MKDLGEKSGVARVEAVGKKSFADRLRGAFPDLRLEGVAGSSAFVSEARPGRLAALIGSFLRSGVG